ncbi:MAG: tetratricopeptide repeat protein, partial [Acidobacteria bacterium]|nr:tetratricopeptide repeat protein [Candidatus Sulfomarinibacter sp. MAG AM2]
ADHSIRIPRPDLSQTIGTPNACSQGGCHDDKPLQWSVDAFTKWYGEAKKPHYGTTLAAGREGRPEALGELVRMAGDELYPAIVRATALTLLVGYPGEESARTFALALVDEDALVRHTAVNDVYTSTPAELAELLAPLLLDPIRAVRMQAAVQLADVPKELLKPYQREALGKALGEYEEAMAYSLDFAHAGYNLGNLNTRLGDARSAERYYLSAIEIDDLFYPAKMNLGILYNSTGRNTEAERVFREVMEADPEEFEVAYLLGLLLAELDRIDEAVEFLGIASDGLPARSRAHYNYGLALQALGRLVEAERPLLKALENEPGEYDYLFALADHYVNRGEWRRALIVADRMIVAQPENRLGSDIRALAEGELRRN